MAKVHITNVAVLDNPSSFYNPFQFELTFECIEELKEDLEWKMIYVGSAESEEYDQVLDTVSGHCEQLWNFLLLIAIVFFLFQIYVGPIPEGRHIFVFQADPPDTSRIPEQDALGVTIVLLTCSYRGQEFVRVGYFINNDYSDQELRENPPAKPLFDKMTRNILATKPRVTRFKINWDDTNGNAEEEQINGGASTSENDPAANGMQFDDLGMEEPQDENSLVMPGNENSNSLAMECWTSDRHLQFSFICVNLNFSL